MREGHFDSEQAEQADQTTVDRFELIPPITLLVELWQPITVIDFSETGFDWSKRRHGKKCQRGKA